MYTQQTQMGWGTVDNVNEWACIHVYVCVHVFVYTSTDINMGLWLSVYEAGNDSVDNQTMKSDTTSWLFFFFFTLQVVTVDKSVLAASVLICAAFGWKCYSRVCTDSYLHERLLMITKKHVTNGFRRCFWSSWHLSFELWKEMLPDFAS